MSPPKCLKCCDLGILPNQMEVLEGPICACGNPSVNEDGSCAKYKEHGLILCECDSGKLITRYINLKVFE